MVDFKTLSGNCMYSCAKRSIGIGFLVAGLIPCVVGHSQSTDLLDRSSEIQVECVVDTLYKILIPARQSGVLTRLLIRKGSVVEAGQVVGQIDDTDALQRLAMVESDLELAKREMESSTRVAFAKQSAEFEKSIYETNQKLAANRVVNEVDVRRSYLSWQRSNSELELTKFEHENRTLEVANFKAQVAIAQKDVDDRKIVSTRDGIVSQTLKSEGEWANQGEPIAVLDHMATLQVKASVSYGEFRPHEISGAMATLIIGASSGEFETFECGPIVQIGPEIILDDKYEVWIDVKNRKEKGHWVLRPRMSAQLTIKLSQPVASRASTRIRE